MIGLCRHLNIQSRLNDKQRQPNSASPTSDLSLWLPLLFQLCLQLLLELLLHELPQGTVEWRDSPDGGRVNALIKIDHLAI